MSISARLAASLLQCLPMTAIAIEAADSAGLDVRIEQLAEPVGVDGNSFRILQARGSQVGQLAERIRQRWQTQGSTMQKTATGSWQIISRWTSQTFEVLQWRSAGRSGEALFSASRIGQRSSRLQVSPFPLPAHCAWGRTITGRTGGSGFEQRSAYCAGRAAVDLEDIAGRLEDSGWRILSTGPRLLHVARSAREAMLIAVQTGSHSGSGLVWIDIASRDWPTP